jgi:hypothetical protein
MYEVDSVDFKTQTAIIIKNETRFKVPIAFVPVIYANKSNKFRAIVVGDNFDACVAILFLNKETGEAKTDLIHKDSIQVI